MEDDVEYNKGLICSFVSDCNDKQSRRDISFHSYCKGLVSFISATPFDFDNYFRRILAMTGNLGKLTFKIFVLFYMAWT